MKTSHQEPPIFLKNNVNDDFHQSLVEQQYNNMT